MPLISKKDLLVGPVRFNSFFRLKLSKLLLHEWRFIVDIKIVDTTPRPRPRPVSRTGADGSLETGNWLAGVAVSKPILETGWLG